MSEVLTIVYDERPDCGYMTFEDKDVKTVEDALFGAESKGALGCHFVTTDGTEFWLRTDKYLYWTVREIDESFREIEAL